MKQRRPQGSGPPLFATARKRSASARTASRRAPHPIVLFQIRVKAEQDLSIVLISALEGARRVHRDQALLLAQRKNNERIRVNKSRIGKLAVLPEVVPGLVEL